MNELVSIIVPVYNTEKYLNRCVSSLLEQTYKDIEIILIDDGSTDKSGIKCDVLAENDDRVRAFHTPNLGAAHARNAGIKEAKGKYISFVDSDDYVDSEMIDVLKSDLVGNNSDLSISSLQEENSYDNFSISLSSEYADQILFLSKNYLIFGPTQKIYKTEIVKQIAFPDNVKYGEDLLFNLEYLKKTKRVSFINRKFYHYCQKESGLSTKARWDMFENDLTLHKALKKWYEDIGVFDKGIKKILYSRVFDTAVNSICLTFKKNCPLDFFETRQLMINIVNNDMVKESLRYANIDKYAKWQTYLIKNRRAFILSIISMLERIMNG